MSVYEVARRLREMLPNAKLIAPTGWAADKFSARGSEAGFDHYIIKPVQIAQLEKLLTKPQP